MLITRLTSHFAESARKREEHTLASRPYLDERSGGAGQSRLSYFLFLCPAGGIAA